MIKLQTKSYWVYLLALGNCLDLQILIEYVLLLWLLFFRFKLFKSGQSRRTPLPLDNHVLKNPNMSIMKSKRIKSIIQDQSVVSEVICFLFGPWNKFFNLAKPYHIPTGLRLLICLPWADKLARLYAVQILVNATHYTLKALCQSPFPQTLIVDRILLCLFWLETG